MGCNKIEITPETKNWNGGRPTPGHPRCYTPLQWLEALPMMADIWPSLGHDFLHAMRGHLGALTYKDHTVTAVDLEKCAHAIASAYEDSCAVEGTTAPTVEQRRIDVLFFEQDIERRALGGGGFGGLNITWSEDNIEVTVTSYVRRSISIKIEFRHDFMVEIGESYFDEHRDYGRTISGVIDFDGWSDSASREALRLLTRMEVRHEKI